MSWEREIDLYELGEADARGLAPLTIHRTNTEEDERWILPPDTAETAILHEWAQVHERELGFLPAWWTVLEEGMRLVDEAR